MVLFMGERERACITLIFLGELFLIELLIASGASIGFRSMVIFGYHFIGWYERCSTGEADGRKQLITDIVAVTGQHMFWILMLMATSLLVHHTHALC